MALASLSVEGSFFAVSGLCECNESPPLHRFFASSQDAGPCGSCGGTLHAHPLGRHVEVPAAELASVLDRPLHALGAPENASIIVRGPDGAVIFAAPAMAAAHPITSEVRV